MKQFSNVWCLILFLCSFHVYADADLDATDCTLQGSTSCEVFLKMDRDVDDVSYKVELADTETGEAAFPYFDMNETTESVSLQKHGEMYVFSKEYLDSTKAIEFITFKYNNKHLSSVKYYYIESSMDFTSNTKEWSGKECKTSAGTISAREGSLLLEAASNLCINKIKLAYRPNEYTGNDLVFYLSEIIDGVKKKHIPLIALDSKNSDAVNLKDVGCLNGCDADSDSVNYIGKLNGKFRIGLHLDYNNNTVSGFYFYEKMKKKINVTGGRNGERLILRASVPEGIETFDGLLEGGRFKGVWSNANGNKKYPFTFYVKLVQ